MTASEVVNLVEDNKTKTTKQKEKKRESRRTTVKLYCAML